MTKSLYSIGLSALILAFTFSSCNNSADDNAQKPESEGTTDQTEHVDEGYGEPESEDMEELDIILPSPLQIASIFKRAGLPFQSDLPNSTTNTTNYSSSTKKSLNFGVYSADLAYAVLNNQPQVALDYLKTVKRLGDDLGLTQVFGTESLYKSFENNLGNEDSMIYVLATIQEELDMYLDDTDQQYMAAVYFAGGWIEAMYLAVQLEKGKDSKIGVRLAEQMNVLENVIRGLKANPSEAALLTELTSELSKLHDFYLKTKSYHNYENKDELELSDLALNEEEYEQVTTIISSLRNKIVNP